MVHANGRTLLFAVHDGDRVGPKLLAKILKDAGISHVELRQLR